MSHTLWESPSISVLVLLSLPRRLTVSVSSAEHFARWRCEYSFQPRSFWSTDFRCCFRSYQHSFPIRPWLADWPSWWSWHHDPYVCLDELIDTMDDALGANAFTLAIEAEVEDFLLVVLAADLIAWNAGHQGWVCTTASTSISIFPHWLPLIGLALAGLIGGHYLWLGNCSFGSIIRCSGLCIGSCDGSLGHGDELLQFRNAFRIKCSSFIAYFADDALNEDVSTFAFFFFFISNANLSEAQSRQRSWLHANINMSSGSFLHFVQGCGWSIDTQII